MFTVKDKQFKGEPFLQEVKTFYTDLINKSVANPEHKLKVFDSESVYLPTKKIGKNNPRAAEIEADNVARQEWNRTADLALVSGYRGNQNPHAVKKKGGDSRENK